MRLLLLIASVVGLIMYIGFVVEQDSAPASALAYQGDIRELQRAFDATGAGLERAVVSGWVRVTDHSARERVLMALGWKADDLLNHGRHLSLRTSWGERFLVLRWSLSDEQAPAWPEAYRRVVEALQTAGAAPHITVHLEGKAATADVGSILEAALDAVGAQARQPWSSPPAASIAGRSALLPASPFGVNIQAAARHNPVDGSTRVWVAWPALVQEY